MKNLKRGLGAQDFMADMDYIHSTPGILSSQKNDSKAIFFQIRDDAFEIVSGDIHRFVKENVSELAVTLDKVTVCHISYTVILTFFYNGRIYCYLNKLATIPAENYDAQGTAHLVVLVLTETLGLSQSRLANLLVHFWYVLYCTVCICIVTVLYCVTVCKCTCLNQCLSFFSYDGVYACELERIDGGGCLKLVEKVETELGMEAGSLSGTWDFAHQL